MLKNRKFIILQGCIGTIDKVLMQQKRIIKFHRFKNMELARFYLYVMILLNHIGIKKQRKGEFTGIVILLPSLKVIN
jgi:hypothetical protein